MFTVHFLFKKNSMLQRHLAHLKFSISSCVAKLPFQSQLGVIQPEQGEQERGRPLERFYIQTDRRSGWGKMESLWIERARVAVRVCICDICTMIPYTVSFSVLSITIGDAWGEGSDWGTEKKKKQGKATPSLKCDAYFDKIFAQGFNDACTF